MMIEIENIVESYNEYIKKIPNGAVYIAERLREDRVQEALISIKDFSEGVLWLTEASELLKQNKAIAELSIEKIKEFLIEINEGLEKHDYVLVADMFEYEIAPFFEEVTPAEGLIQYI